jgi:hypothetical protein
MENLNVYHKYDILLPSKPDIYWIVHDEISNIHKQAIINSSIYHYEGKYE